ncbi:hypothetical protein BTO25_06515 [Bacillus sp. MB366]|nr:hypothetical protein BTO25_06515 [Bacillus sp. MB366]OOR41943.1 hypothetical protein BW895_06620 [Bacillus cereus]OOR45609.1 hypothetical protein BW896_13020 [Bacillus cereus]QCX97018.1 hypothetical protein EJ379_26825 [Bacillus cereus ATCC 14579]
MSHFKYYRRNLKLHYVEFEILLVVFEIGVKIKKVTLGRATFSILFPYWNIPCKAPIPRVKTKKTIVIIVACFLVKPAVI